MFSRSLSHAVVVRGWTRWSLTIASAVLAVSPILADDRKIVAPLSIVVIDYAGTPMPVMREAVLTAGRIFHDAGVNATWTTRSAADLMRAAAHPDEADADIFGTVFVQLLNAEMAARYPCPASVLGRALPGSQMAWVLTPRVKRTAQDQKQAFGTLLGHVIAHEIGHLLLPTGSHTRTGLMAAAMDLQEISRRGLRFDADHSELIRARLLAGFPVARVTSTR